MTNPYLIAILVLLIGLTAVDAIANLLNLSKLGDDLPEEFRPIYDRQKYLESLKYQREGVCFHLFSDLISLAITIAFILVGGFEKVDQFARSFELNLTLTGLIFLGTLFLLQSAIHLPFSIYETFNLEARYGFNQTSVKTFVTDRLKGLLIGGILGSLLFSGFVFFFENTGDYGWLYCWIAFTAFQLALMYIAPAFIMPLFNRFTPLLDGPVKQAIETYAKTRNFRLNGIFTMDGSKRSSKSNAFFTGFGAYRRLVLFDTLLKNQTSDELVAVIAHEVGHFECNHIFRMLSVSILSSATYFYLLGFLKNNSDIFSAFQMSHLSIYASIVFTGFLLSPLSKILSVFTHYLSRKHEFEADEFSRRTYGKPEALISALKKLSVDHLSHLTPHPFKVALDYTHPPILKRIQALREISS